MTNGSLKLTFLCNDSLFKTAFYFEKENFMRIYGNGDKLILEVV